jgi:hypothetical protein
LAVPLVPAPVSGEHFYDNSLFLSQLCPVHKAAK